MLSLLSNTLIMCEEHIFLGHGLQNSRKEKNNNKKSEDKESRITLQHTHVFHNKNNNNNKSVIRLYRMMEPSYHHFVYYLIAFI